MIFRIQVLENYKDKYIFLFYLKHDKGIFHYTQTHIQLQVIFVYVIHHRYKKADFTPYMNILYSLTLVYMIIFIFFKARLVLHML